MGCLDCMDVAVGLVRADRKVVQKSVSFLKRSMLTVRFSRYGQCGRPLCVVVLPSYFDAI